MGIGETVRWDKHGDPAHLSRIYSRISLIWHTCKPSPRRERWLDLEPPGLGEERAVPDCAPRPTESRATSQGLELDGFPRMTCEPSALPQLFHVSPDVQGHILCELTSRTKDARRQPTRSEALVPGREQHVTPCHRDFRFTATTEILRMPDSTPSHACRIHQGNEPTTSNTLLYSIRGEAPLGWTCT